MESGNSIRFWSEDDRPREKLLLKGRQHLSDAELLAILIRTGTKGNSALDLARNILLKVGNSLDRLAKLSPEDLKNLEKGLGNTKATTIVAAMELGRRRHSEPDSDSQFIRSSSDAYAHFQPVLSDLPHEEFYVLFLNRANKVLARKQISRGGLTGTVADVRIIARQALDLHASGLVLSHNHPSGNLTPSQSDLDLTKKLKEACKMFDINILDHLIVGNKGYFSFADQGLI